MNLKSPALTRRTFLGAAGAAVAVTIAHTSFNTLLTDRPLEVAALLDGEASLAALQSVITSHIFGLQTVRTNSVALCGKATELLRQMSAPIVAAGMSVWQADLLQLPNALLIFGRWQGYEPMLLHLLQRRLAIYVDDPALAVKLGKGRVVHPHQERSLAGLTSMMDPALEHAESRLRSGVMGDVSDLAVVIRNRDEISDLEVAAALRQLAKHKRVPKERRMVTRNLQAGIHVTCVRGQLHVPLYSAEERTQTLPLRLQHFALVARGEVMPAISLPEMVSLSESMYFMYRSYDSAMPLS